MNPRDIPEIVAELIIEMHEVRSELQGLNGRVDRLERTMSLVVDEQRGMRAEMHGMRAEMHGMREEMRALPQQISAGIFQAMEPFLNRLLDHNDQLKSYDGRLNRLENPQT